MNGLRARNRALRHCRSRDRTKREGTPDFDGGYSIAARSAIPDTAE